MDSEFSREKIPQQQSSADADVLRLIVFISRVYWTREGGRASEKVGLKKKKKERSSCVKSSKWGGGQGNKKVIVDLSKLHLIASHSFPLRSLSRLCNCRKTGLNAACKI